MSDEQKDRGAWRTQITGDDTVYGTEPLTLTSEQLQEVIAQLRTLPTDEGEPREHTPGCGGSKELRYRYNYNRGSYVVIDACSCGWRGES